MRRFVEAGNDAAALHKIIIVARRVRIFWPSSAAVDPDSMLSGPRILGLGATGIGHPSRTIRSIPSEVGLMSRMTVLQPI
jgi:hypothetical protein